MLNVSMQKVVKQLKQNYFLIELFFIINAKVNLNYLFSLFKKI